MTAAKPKAEEPQEAASVDPAMQALLDKVAELTATVEELKAAPPPPAPTAPTILYGPTPPDVARKAVLARRSKKPKTYRALRDGTDLSQGYIKAGEVFSTCQPQGSWMELVEGDAAEG